MLRKAFKWDEAKVTAVLKTTAAVRGGILGLLMLSLAAIRSITLDDYVWSDPLWIKSIVSIEDQQDPRLGGSKAKFLTDLSELNLDDQNRGRDLGRGCRIVPFFTLPSLRTIRGIQLSANAIITSSMPDYHGHRSSPVTELYLDRSSLDIVCLGEILRCMQGLKQFRYDQDIHTNNSYNAKTGSIINELLKYTSHSLESLTVTSGFHGGDDKELKPSLKAFRVLKNIDIPAGFCSHAGIVVPMVARLGWRLSP